MRAAMIGLVLTTVPATTGQAQEAPTVVELVTSQGCASCPTGESSAILLQAADGRIIGAARNHCRPTRSQ
jgi:hypothetical protein